LNLAPSAFDLVTRQIDSVPYRFTHLSCKKMLFNNDARRWTQMKTNNELRCFLHCDRASMKETFSACRRLKHKTTPEGAGC
ncbi:MAG: hypothetical protein KBH86_10285, partial [Syntrophorhabdus sp.]|nr:hypothetical protein [Syntrophorhabdus sp.]